MSAQVSCYHWRCCSILTVKAFCHGFCPDASYTKRPIGPLCIWRAAVYLKYGSPFLVSPWNCGIRMCYRILENWRRQWQVPSQSASGVACGMFGTVGDGTCTLLTLWFELGPDGLEFAACGAVGRRTGAVSHPFLVDISYVRRYSAAGHHAADGCLDDGTWLLCIGARRGFTMLTTGLWLLLKIPSWRKGGCQLGTFGIE